MTDKERLEMRKAADKIWQAAKECQDFNVANMLKQMSTDLHYKASVGEGNDLEIPNRC